MELSLLVARILALTYIAAGISAVRGRPTYQEMVDDFLKSPGLTYVTGFFTMVIGMLLVSYHNIWVRDWTVLITIVGWLSLIKGIMLIAFPQTLTAFSGWYKNTKAWGLILIIFGLVFAYFGFCR